MLIWLKDSAVAEADPPGPEPAATPLAGHAGGAGRLAWHRKCPSVPATMTPEAAMPLHTQVDESHKDAEIDVNPIYFRELSCEIPRYRLAASGVLPRTALQLVRDELILDGNARLNLATFVTTWMEPEAEQLMAETAPRT